MFKALKISNIRRVAGYCCQNSWAITFSNGSVVRQCECRYPLTTEEQVEMVVELTEGNRVKVKVKPVFMDREEHLAYLREQSQYDNAVHDAQQFHLTRKLEGYIERVEMKEILREAMFGRNSILDLLR